MITDRQLEKLARWLIYFIMAFLPFQVDFELEFLYNLWLTPLLVALLLLFLILIGYITFFGKFPAVPFLGLILIYGLLSSFSYLRAYEFNSIFQVVWVILRLAWLPLFAYVVTWRFLDKKASMFSLKMLVCFAALSSTIAVIQTISTGRILGGFITNQRYLGILQKLPDWIVAGRMDNLYLLPVGIYRGHGGFHSSNLFGAFLCMTMCISWVLFKRAQNRRGFWMTVFLLQIAGILVTFSRSAFAAGLVSFILILVIEQIYFNKQRLEIRILLTLTGVSIFILFLMTVLIFSESLRSRFLSIFDPFNVPEFAWRIMVWETALEKILTHPWIGTGMSGVISLPDRFGNLVTYGAHNLFVGVAYEQGLVSLLIFSYLLLVGLLQNSWKMVSKSTDRDERYIGLGVLAATVSFAISGIGSNLMSFENLSIAFWSFLGIVMNWRQQLSR